MEIQNLYNDEPWKCVATILPERIDDAARESNALWRCMQMPNAQTVLRNIFADAIFDLFIIDVAAWSSSYGLEKFQGLGCIVACPLQVYISKLILMIDFCLFTTSFWKIQM